MNSQLYTLTALTNLHVGSGDSHYGIIDNLVQRDILTKYPAIHASSLKGALRQAYETSPSLNKDKLKKLFGDSPQNGQEGMAGSYFFGSPQLLSFPVRSDKVPFLNVTSPGLLQHLIENQNQFGFSLTNLTELKSFCEAVRDVAQPTVYNLTLNQAILERHSIKTTMATNPNPQASALKTLLGNNLAVVPDQILAKLCGVNRLPVIARNNLENGISRNLWYEEVVPRQTRFWFWVYPKKNESELAGDFTKLLASPIQIGANASIGYGFCEIKRQS